MDRSAETQFSEFAHGRWPDLARLGYGLTGDRGRSGAFASLTNNGGSPVLNYGIVRADVAYLRVKLTNGQVLTVRPVDVFGQRYARYVAFAVPYDAAVTELIAYSARAELGYAIPFTRAGEFWNRWIPAGLPALPAPASYLIGSGVAGRSAWSVHLDVGPWGTCQVISAMRPGFAVAWCPVPGLRPGRVAQILHGEDPLVLVPSVLPERSLQVPEIAIAQTAPAVSYLVLTSRDGSSFRVPAVSVGRWRYCAFQATGIWPTQRAGRIPRLAVVRMGCLHLSWPQTWLRICAQVTQPDFRNSCGSLG